MGRDPLPEEFKSQKETISMTQTVNKRAKLDLDSLTHKLSAYAIKNGIKRPNKGDVLSKLISHGVKDFDIPGYFNQA